MTALGNATFRFGAIVLALMTFGCQAQKMPPPPQQTLAAVKPSLNEAARAQLEQCIFLRINALRTTADPKLVPLTPEGRLTAIARDHSLAWSQTQPTGGATDPHFSADRLMERDAKFQGILGENAAALPLSPIGPIDIEASAARIVAIWLASSKHKENLLFSRYRSGAVGIVLAGDTLFVTALLAVDLNAVLVPPKAPPPSADPGTMTHPKS